VVPGLQAVYVLVHALQVEFKKWCPAFKLLTYYGSAKERKAKRQGWSKPNAFHVAITSYTLILQVRAERVPIAVRCLRLPYCMPECELGNSMRSRGTENW
jgi:hypothetical protein